MSNVLISATSTPASDASLDAPAASQLPLVDSLKPKPGAGGRLAGQPTPVRPGLYESMELSDLAACLQEPGETSLTRVKVNSEASPLVIFTGHVIKTRVHFVDGPDMRDYVRCPGAGCPCCPTETKPNEQFLLAVYNPLSRKVEVLMFSGSMRPFALLPQIMPLTKAAVPTVAFVSKIDTMRFKVVSRPLRADEDHGVEATQRYLADFAAGRVHPTDALTFLDATVLAMVPAVADRLKWQMA